MTISLTSFLRFLTIWAESPLTVARASDLLPLAEEAEMELPQPTQEGRQTTLGKLLSGAAGQEIGSYRVERAKLTARGMTYRIVPRSTNGAGK